MIGGIIYAVLAILAVIYPEDPIPNEALVLLLISNLWMISAGSK